MSKRTHEEAGLAKESGAEDTDRTALQSGDEPASDAALASVSGGGGNNKRPRLRHSSLKKHAFLFNRGEERRGIIVTSIVHREAHALVQVMNLLYHYARKFHPEEADREQAQEDARKENADVDGDGEGEEEGDREGSAEVRSDQKDTGRVYRKKLFSVYDSGGISGIFFVAVNSSRIDVVEFIRRIFTDAEFPQQAKLCDACHRLIPIQRVCAANETDIASTAQELVPGSFPAAEAPVKFAIVFDKRNNDGATKTAIVPRIASLVPSGHSVDLRAPELVILVYIFKSACGLCVTSDYHRFAKYNMHTVAKGASAKQE